ncbi:hypothetical protein POM88_011537 [Heracleum sosnowskyi]|uniref:Uncharacterized protein n=1 Tax=Heracleum sosnowskyi TaxID=360622 RepID=A0AAD8IVN2_9APIA|nr:hypothetical protein POM88_011537 [Heracleum sosnowskyi]
MAMVIALLKVVELLHSGTVSLSYPVAFGVNKCGEEDHKDLEYEIVIIEGGKRQGNPVEDIKYMEELIFDYVLCFPQFTNYDGDLETPRLPFGFRNLRDNMIATMEYKASVKANRTSNFSIIAVNTQLPLTKGYLIKPSTADNFSLKNHVLVPLDRNNDGREYETTLEAWLSEYETIHSELFRVKVSSFGKLHQIVRPTIKGLVMVIALLKVVELLHSGTVSLSYPVAFGVNKFGEEDHKDFEYEIVIIEGGERQGNPVEDIKYMEELILDYVLCFPQFTNYDGDLETPRLPFGFRNLRDNMIATMEYKASVKANRTSNFSIIAVNTQLPLTKGYLIKPSTADNFSLKNHVLVPLDRNNDGREYETTLEAWLSEYETIHSELFRVKVSSFGKLHQIVRPTIKGLVMVIALLKVVELLHSGTVSLSYPVAFGVNKFGEEDHKDLEYEIVIIEGGERQGNPVEDIKYMEELIFDYVLCFPQFTNYDGDLETPRLPFGFRNLRDNMIATMEYKASVKANRTSNFSIIAVNTQLPLTKGYLIKPSTADNFSLKNHVLVPLDRNNDGREYETTLEAWLSEYETIHSELFRVKVSSFGKLHQIVRPTIKGLVMVIALLKVVELLHSGTVSLSYPVAFGVNKFGEEDHKDLEYEIVIIEGGERQGNPVEDIKYMEELIFNYVLCFPQFTNYDGDLETPRLPFGFRNLRDNMIATMEYKASVKANRTSNFSIIAVNTQLPLTKGYLIKPSTADNFSLKNHFLVPLDRNNDGREYETTLEAWLSEYETIHSELFRVKVSSFGKLHQIVRPTIKGLVMVIALLKVVELLHSGNMSSVKFGKDAKYLAAGIVDWNILLFGLPEEDNLLESEH